MSIQKIFDQSKSGMTTSQKGLSVTSHNISNINTEGYSRQRAENEAVVSNENSNISVGGGARLKQVSRAHSSFLSRRIESENADMGKARAAHNVFSQIENVFANDAEKGISATMSGFFNNVRSLSSEPNSMPMRSAVVESAKSVARTFNGTDNALSDIKEDIDNRIEATVVKVNSLSDKIGALNKQIMTIEGSLGVANDERDQRDLAIRHLSELVDVQVTDIDHGGVTVSSGQIGPLVAGVDSYHLDTVREGNEDFASVAKVVVKNSTGSSFRDVSSLIKGGELGAYTQARDVHLSEMKDSLDTLASEFMNNVNELNRGGFDRNGRPGGDIFMLDGGNGVAGGIQVSAGFQADPSLLAGAQIENAAGDNRGFLALSDLETQKAIGGESTFNDYMSEIVGRVGVETRGFRESMETQEGLLQQLDTLREEESGVSLDEETLNMVKYQKAFDASAKLIQVADSMLETVINLKRF